MYNVIDENQKQKYHFMLDLLILNYKHCFFIPNCVFTRLILLSTCIQVYAKMCTKKITYNKISCHFANHFSRLHVANILHAINMFYAKEIH